MGTSLFTNCFGEVNYDAMAGLGVANAIFSVAGQAISSSKAEKQNKKAEYENNKAEIEKINQEISSNTSTKEELKTKNTTLQNDIDTASAKSKDLAGQISNKNSEITNLQAEYDRLTTAASSDETQKDAQQEALKKLNTAKEELKKLEKEKEAQDKIIKENNTKIEANNKQIDELNKKIDELETQKAELQESVNDVVLDNADGSKWKRTSKEDFDKKWNEAEKAEFTKSDMRYAIAVFKNATTTEEKKEWANKIATIYKNINEANPSDITSDFKAARQIVDKYVD